MRAYAGDVKTKQTLAAAPLRHATSAAPNQRSQPWCTHCERAGHTKETCFALNPKLRPPRAAAAPAKPQPETSHYVDTNLPPAPSLPSVPEESDHLALMVDLCNERGVAQGGLVAYGAPPVAAPKPVSLASPLESPGEELYTFPFVMQVANHLKSHPEWLGSDEDPYDVAVEYVYNVDMGV